MKDMTLAALEELLLSNGRSLTEFPLMPIPSDRDFTNYQERMIVEELNFDMFALLERLNHLLSSVQQMNKYMHITRSCMQLTQATKDFISYMIIEARVRHLCRTCC